MPSRSSTDETRVASCRTATRRLPSTSWRVPASTSDRQASDEYNLNSRQGLPSLSINGTKAQINDTLKLLEYKPTRITRPLQPRPPAHLLKVDGSNDPSPEVSVELRVQGFNDWPELKADHEVGDAAGDGPADQVADPGVELTIPGNYALEDVDNDDITDGNGPPADTDGWTAMVTTYWSSAGCSAVSPSPPVQRISLQRLRLHADR